MAAVKRVLAAGLALALGSAAGADSSLGLRFNHYLGSDGVEVQSPQASLAAAVDDRTQVSLDYGVDAVSAASFNYANSKTHLADPLRAVGNCKLCHGGVDAISGASLNYREQRQELDVGLVRKVGETDLKPAYLRSQENDYSSQTFVLGASRGFFLRDSNLDLEARHSDNSIQAVWNKARIDGMEANAGVATLTQVLTPRSQARLSAELGQEQGLLSNPYSFIEIGAMKFAPVPETEPEERLHWLLGAQWKQSLGHAASLELDYRYYSDDWDVEAHTLQGRLDKDWGSFTLEAGWRHYTQSQAWFFQNAYSQPQAYMTRDLKLAAFNDDLLSLSLRGQLDQAWDVDLSYAHYLRHDDLDYSGYFANGPASADLVSLGFTYH